MNGKPKKINNAVECMHLEMHNSACFNGLIKALVPISTGIVRQIEEQMT